MGEFLPTYVKDGINYIRFHLQKIKKISLELRNFVTNLLYLCYVQSIRDVY